MPGLGRKSCGRDGIMGGLERRGSIKLVEDVFSSLSDFIIWRTRRETKTVCEFVLCHVIHFTAAFFLRLLLPFFFQTKRQRKAAGSRFL